MKNEKSAVILYANWPEGYVNQRFIDALVQKYNVSTFFFDESGTEIIRIRYPKIEIPLSVKKVTLKDPPLLKLPLNLKLATKKGNIGWVLKFFMRAFLFRRMIRKLHPDLVIGNGVSGTNPYGFCCAFSGYHPFIVLVWGSDILIEAKKSIFLKLITKFVLKKADGVIVDSEVKSRAVIELGGRPDNIWKFPWGIDLQMFSPSGPSSGFKEKLGWKNNKIVISTRNHFPVYGLEYLIRAIPTVIKEVPDARFLIIGSGPLSDDLRKIAMKLGVENYVFFAGKVPNHELPDFLRVSDLYVSTSISDGASVSLLEAMACGLPVVVSDIPGNSEWVHNTQNGLLFQTGNSDELAEKISYLLKNDGFRRFAGNINVELTKNKADWKKNASILCQAVETLRKHAQ